MFTIKPISIHQFGDASYVIARALNAMSLRMSTLHFEKCLRESTPEVLYWRSRAGVMFVVERYDVVVAVFSVEKIPGTEYGCELGTLFVHPYVQKSGIGTMCVRHAEDFARKAGYRTMCIYAEPTAFGFYQRNGYNFTEQQFGEGYIILYKQLV